MTSTDARSERVPSAAVWAPPGPGSWRLERSHGPPAPTPIFMRFMRDSIETGMARTFARFGAPLAGMQVRFVRGKFYMRLVPLVGGDRDMRPPPAPVLWLAARLHPAFRRRERAARRAFRDKTWRAHLDHWHRVDRSRCIAANLAIQDEDPGGLDDEQLADHVQRAYDNLIAGTTLHHELHGVDLGPVGDLLAHTSRWGIPPSEVVPALVGASPASAEAAATLARLGALVAASGATAPVRTLDDIRAAGPEAAELLDEYLRHFGWRLVTSYDIEGNALIEMPDAIVRSVIAAAEPREAPDGTARVDALRERVPPEHRALFDELMADARAVYGLRDDNGPLTAEWPLGLLRRAVLEAGARLAARGRIHHEEDVFELDVDELVPMVRDGSGPSADALTERGAERAVWAAEEAPPLLGPAEDDPPLHLLPAGLARGSAAVLAAVAAIDPPAQRARLEGTGIGDTPYRGTARVAHRPEDVLATMAPGDVLVAAWTAPTFNTVLSIAGAVVTEEGGVLCHAAVMARELGIPAVIGAQGAMAAIADGALVEVDPVAGRVSVVVA